MEERGEGGGGEESEGLRGRGLEKEGRGRDLEEGGVEVRWGVRWKHESVNEDQCGAHAPLKAAMRHALAF